MVFHTDLDKPFQYGPRFVHGGIVMLKQDRACQSTHLKGCPHTAVLYSEAGKDVTPMHKGISLFSLFDIEAELQPWIAEETKKLTLLGK